MWPEIATRILALHPTLTEISQVENAMPETIGVHLGEHHESSIELVYDLDLPDEGNCGYFIEIVNERVGRAISAE